MIEKLSSRFYGRVGYLLVLVAVLNFGYPLTLYMGGLGNLLFLLAYTLMFVIGVLVTSEDKKHFIQTSIAAVVWMVCAVVSFFAPSSDSATIISQVAIIPAQLLMTIALLRYIYTSKVVNANVMMTAITVYIFIAAMFTPLYVIVSRLDVNAFVDNGLGVAPQWQQLVYFSFVTLATLGYGDVLPLNAWARSLATVEGMLGVLYIALIMGRLIGVYSQERD
ncbi:MAG: two pore domain potassium channel family protein [Anaerolineales bacterium]|nr:two pore domain potassium channel family protein [Anaerolineales bacterium]